MSVAQQSVGRNVPDDGVSVTQLTVVVAAERVDLAVSAEQHCVLQTACHLSDDDVIVTERDATGRQARQLDVVCLQLTRQVRAFA